MSGHTPFEVVRLVEMSDADFAHVVNDEMREPWPNPVGDTLLHPVIRERWRDLLRAIVAKIDEDLDAPPPAHMDPVDYMRWKKGAHRVRRSASGRLATLNSDTKGPTVLSLVEAIRHHRNATYSGGFQAEQHDLDLWAVLDD